MKYKQKPVTIDAVQFTGNNDADVAAFVEKNKLPFDGDTLVVQTKLGTFLVGKNDWLIKDEKGQIYPMKTEQFEEKYEATVEELPSTLVLAQN